MSDVGKYDRLTTAEDAKLLLAKAEKDGIDTAWDRHEAQLPQCAFCEMGLSCRICSMGPCRVDPFGEGVKRGFAAPMPISSWPAISSG